LTGRIHRSLRALVSTPERRLLFIALLVRLVPAALIFGSEDVSGSWTWGRAIDNGASPYATSYLMAWPPPWLPFAWFAYHVAETTDLPFHLVVKCLPIAADVILTFLLYSAARDHGRAPFRTALLYALNPVAIYMTAIHGNFDAIPALCATSAVILAHRIDDDRAQHRAAAWLGVGAAFKTWPLFILPALVAPLKTLRRRAAAAAIAAGIFIAALLLPWPFAGLHSITDALRYRGAGNWWGIGSLSFLFHDAIPASALMAIFYAAMAAAALRLFIAPAPAARGALLLLLTFLVTAPGFGMQYLIWIVPIALLADQRRGVVYSILAGCTLAWEMLLRPYTGHPGDIVRLLPHPGFHAAYGHGADHVNTVVERLVLWAFVCYWWVATIVSIVRARGGRGNVRTIAP
jgi:hypothetical protein